MGGDVTGGEAAGGAALGEAATTPTSWLQRLAAALGISGTGGGAGRSDYY